MGWRAAPLLLAVAALVAFAIVHHLWTRENPVVEYARLKGLEDEVIHRLQPLGRDRRIEDLERRLIEKLLSLPPQKRLSPEVLLDLENVAKDGEVTESELALLEDRHVSPEPPKISGLGYEATDVRNEKVYEVTITFLAEDSKTRVAKARLQWIPVKYEHLPREAFPEEGERIYELEPIDGSYNSLREEFRVRVSGFAGGREYVVRVEVWDEAGNKATAELRTEYFREFENVAKLDDVLVGAYYYPWYGSGGRHWEEGYRGRPLLGEYDSQDPVVICKHIDWATGHGIDFFLVSWWGPDTYEDVVFREHLLKSQLAGSIKFAVLYETLGRLKAESGPSGLAVNLNDPWNLEKLRSDVLYLQQSYFNHPSYLRVEGKPLVELYLARAFTGDVEEAISALREEVDVYLLGDLVYWQSLQDSSGLIGLFDGLTSYNMHTSVPSILADFEILLREKYWEWRIVLEVKGVDFIPSAIPGFDDRAVRTGNLPLPRSLDRFKEQLRIALGYSWPRKAIIIASFNGWHEYTSIEPSKEYGTTYLEAVREACEQISEQLEASPILEIVKAGVTHYEVRLASSGQVLIYLEPDMWQGNSDVYPVTGGYRVGHHWSQFLMLSPGRWLTDRVESEGQFLIDFKILKERGSIVAYAGRWGFRDYFITDAIHYIWVQNNTLYRYVKTNLTVLKDIPDPVGAIWVELMNEPESYKIAVTKTKEGLIVYNMSGVTGHALKEYALERYGWIALVHPSRANGSPALVLISSSHEVHPTIFNGPNVDNIELHLMGKDEVRMLEKGEYFELNYLLIVSTEKDDYTWIDEAIRRAEPITKIIMEEDCPPSSTRK